MSLRLSENRYVGLRQIADERQTSMSAVVMEAIDAVLGSSLQSRL